MICVWNGGRETVDERDVVTEHPVAFAIREDGNPVPILRSKVAAASRGDIGLEVKPGVDANTGVVAFSFLDGGDGALIEVLHCGSPDCVVDFSGTIKGAPWGIEPFEKSGRLDRPSRHARVRDIAVQGAIFAAMLMGLAIFSFRADPFWLRTVVSAPFPLFVITSLIMSLWAERLEVPRRLRPRIQ
jgi:hypothetical protein